MSEHHPVFEGVVAGVIVANTGLLIWSACDPAHEEMINHIETACLVFFVVELLVRMRMEGWRNFVRSGWNVFDTSVIALALLPVLGLDVSLLRVARLTRLARLVHLGRHISGLRLIVLARWWVIKRHTQARWHAQTGSLASLELRP